MNLVNKTYQLKQINYKFEVTLNSLKNEKKRKKTFSQKINNQQIEQHAPNTRWNLTKQSG